MRKLPNLIYVKWDEGSPGDPFLLAQLTPQEISEHNSKVRAGLYKLVHEAEITSNVNVRTIRKRKR